MKLKLAAALAAFSAFTAPALAATDGCPVGTFSVTPNGDDLVTVLFNEVGAPFYGNAGSPDPDSVQIGCDLQPFGPQAGFNVFSADYRGFAFITEAGQTVTLTSTGPNGQVGTQIINGPADAQLDLSQLVGTLPGQALDISILLDLQAAGGAALNAGLDSVDFTRVGFTTWDSVQASIDLLASQRSAIVTHLGGTADLLMGFLQPLEGPNQVAPLVAFGSSLFGANGRFNLGNGFSLVGGAGWFHQSYGGADVGGAFLLGGALRYVSPSVSALRAFGEVGVWGSPSLRLAFSRGYDNFDDVVTATGETNGWIASFYTRVGGIYSIDTVNQLTIAATLAHTSLHVSGYAEPMSLDNLFAADVEGATNRSNSIKATAAWTTDLPGRLDLTLTGGIGHAFGGALVDADVAFVGDVEGEAGGHTFVEYGARLGWDLSPNATIDLFAAGTAGRGIGVHTQVGGAIRLNF